MDSEQIHTSKSQNMAKDIIKGYIYRLLKDTFIGVSDMRSISVLYTNLHNQMAKNGRGNFEDYIDSSFRYEAC